MADSSAHRAHMRRRNRLDQDFRWRPIEARRPAANGSLVAACRMSPNERHRAGTRHFSSFSTSSTILTTRRPVSSPPTRSGNIQYINATLADWLESRSDRRPPAVVLKLDRHLVREDGARVIEFAGSTSRAAPRSRSFDHRFRVERRQGGAGPGAAPGVVRRAGPAQGASRSHGA